MGRNGETFNINGDTAAGAIAAAAKSRSVASFSQGTLQREKCRRGRTDRAHCRTQMPFQMAFRRTICWAALIPKTQNRAERNRRWTVRQGPSFLGRASPETPACLSCSPNMVLGVLSAVNSGPFHQCVTYRCSPLAVGHSALVYATDKLKGNV